LPGAQWKFAVLTGKKIGDAVTRNRHRRWARETLRKARAQWSRPGHVIIRFNQPAQSYSQVQSGILEAYNLANPGQRHSD